MLAVPSFICPNCNESETEQVDRRMGDDGGLVYTVECRSCEHRWEVPF